MIADRDIQLVEETVRDLLILGQHERARAVEAVLNVATSRATAFEAEPTREYLTAGQAADALGVSRQTIKRWVASGRLPGRQLGDRTMVHRNAVLTELQRLQEERRPSDSQSRATEGDAAEREWQQVLRAGLPADKVDRLEALHEMMEDGQQLSHTERKEMVSLERDVVDAAARQLQGWLRKQALP